MTITLASTIKDIFMKESAVNPMWTIQDIEKWLKTKKAFVNAQMLRETSGGFLDNSKGVTSKTYSLQDESVILISNDGIEEINL